MDKNWSYTNSFLLPGGQDRLRQMILYVCQKGASMQRFGRIKLNKILWKSDFDAFADRRRAVTGRAYQRLKHGPAPREMKPLLRDMINFGLIAEELTNFAEGMTERRPIALREPDLSMFDKSDLMYVDRAVDHYFNMTGTETSDDSHGAAWSSRSDLDPMPYESSYLSDKRPSGEQLERLRGIIRANGYQSN